MRRILGYTSLLLLTACGESPVQERLTPSTETGNVAAVSASTERNFTCRNGQTLTARFAPSALMLFDGSQSYRLVKVASGFYEGSLEGPLISFVSQDSRWRFTLRSGARFIDTVCTAEV